MSEDIRFFEAIRDQIAAEMRDGFQALDQTVIEDLKPRLEQIAASATTLLGEALTGKEIEREKLHLRAQLANLEAEKEAAARRILSTALSHLLVRLARLLADVA